VKVLVDTNVLSELKRGRNAAPNVVAWFIQIPSDQVFTSVVVLGEIRRGIELVARRDKAQAEALERWYAAMRQRFSDRVLVVDERVMTIWSRISVPDMLPAYDGLIAATALVQGMTVATRNTTDYRRVGIDVIDPWSEPSRR
jgi:predicted nucleic acid-binding protein